MSTFLVSGFLKPLVNGWYKFIYGAVMLVFKALASVLDALTQLFFVFAGMTPVSSGALDSDGKTQQVDIVNFFLQNSKFQSAYLNLCLIALGLIVVFTIGRIIKQDYFDRSGPRSKGPIFRNVALSFIAFICIIPVFYFLVSTCGALALAVMRAMGYEGGGLGTMVFNMSWSDNGIAFQEVGVALGGENNPDNFTWYPSETFFHFYRNEGTAEAWNMTEGYNNSTIYANGRPEFYWYVCLFGSLILIIQLGKMILAMLSRIYKLISLFLVAPSPISQIVLDDGARFKAWKDQVVQEALKVVGCVMSFMVFVMIITTVNGLELTEFINQPESASAISLIEDNGLAEKLSDVNLLYYGGNVPNTFDKLLNAVGKMLLILAGGGAIADIDSTISPFLSGASSSLDAGGTGKSIMGVGAAVGGFAKNALNLVGQGVGAAAGGVAGAFGKRGLAREKAKDILEEKTKETKENKPSGGEGNSGGTSEGASNPANMNAPQTPVNEGADQTASREGENDAAENQTSADTKENKPSDEEENSGGTSEGANNPTSESKPEAPDKEKNDDKDKKEDSRPELTKKQKDAFVKSEGKKAFWKSIGGSLAKTAKKAPLNLLKLAGGAAASVVGAALKATGYGAVVDAVSGKGGMIENMKGAYAKHSGSSGKKYAEKKAARKEAIENKAQEKRLDEFISNQQQKKDKSPLDAKSPTTPKAMELMEAYDKYKSRSSDIDKNEKTMDDAVASLNTNKGEYNADNVAEAAPKILEASENIEKSADSMIDYAAQTNQNVDRQLLYSGDANLEQNYNEATRNYEDASSKTDAARKAYNDAQQRYDDLGKAKRPFETRKQYDARVQERKDLHLELPHLKAEYKKAQANQNGTKNQLGKVSSEREKVAKKNNTLRYQHIKATEKFEDAMKHAPRGGVRGRKEVSVLKNSLSEKSKALNKRIAKNNEQLYFGETEKIKAKYNENNSSNQAVAENSAVSNNNIEKVDNNIRE